MLDMRNAFDSEQSPDSRLKSSKFVDEVFQDRLELESWVTSRNNYQFLQGQEAANQPKNEKTAEIMRRMCPTWYQIPKERIALDPRDVADVEILRDLGPTSRKMI